MMYSSTAKRAVRGDLAGTPTSGYRGIFIAFRWGLPLFLTFCTTVSSYAQFGGVATLGDKNSSVNVFQPAPSDVRKPLMRAKRASEEGRFVDAAFELGRLLTVEKIDDVESQDYFLFDSDTDRPLGEATLKWEVQRLIGDLPKEGRQAYELQFGAQAQALLDEALTEGDMDKLSDVIRRFLHTKAGYEASILAGRYELGCGRPTAAALHLQRVAETASAARQFEPELSMLLATCWLYAELPDKARETLIAMRDRAGTDTLELGNESVKLFGDDADALPWFEKLIGQRHSLVAPELTQWVLFRGNPQRNGRSKGSLPLLHHRWRVPTCIDRADEKLVEKLNKQYRDEGQAALTVLQPLAVGDTILMRTPRKLLGVDFSSGKRIWVWPHGESESESEWFGEAGRKQVAEATREREIQQRIWDDAAHGQLSSDGKSVYLIHELGYAPTGNSVHNGVFIMRGGVPAMPGASLSNNELVSLTLSSQGKAQWIVGGTSGEDEPKLAGAFFLGAPLPLRGRLYVLAEFNGEIRLCVLDGKNGRLLWQQQLAHVEQNTIQYDGSRRLAGATPSYEGGVLLCPTSAGALVAVDIASRSLLWGYQYIKIPTQSINRGFGIVQVRQQMAQKQPVGSRWLDASVTVSGGRVLVTPVETGTLHCLDQLTGKPVWEPKPRENRLFLACVHQAKAVFVGSESVSALKLADGESGWNEPIKLDDPPSGRGFYSDRYYFLPTTGSELLKIDLDKGEIAMRSPTSIVLGNLICYRDEIISHGPDWMSTYYQSEALQARVEDALAKNPDDLDAMARYGELLLAQGMRDEAIDKLRQVAKLQPENESVRSMLVETLMTALKEDFSAHLNTVDEIESLVEHPSQRNRLLRLLASGWQGEGQVEKAFTAYLGLAELKDKLVQRSGSYEREAEEIERHWNCRTDRWLQARFGELLSVARDSERETIEQTIQQWRDEALSASDVSKLRRFIRYFGAHPDADRVRLKLANQLIETGELTEAELLLTPLEDDADGEIQRQATAALAVLLENGRQFDEALQYYQLLATRWGAETCRNGQTGSQLCEAALERVEIQEAVQRAKPWPTGQVNVAESGGDPNPYSPSRRVYSCTVKQRSGPAPMGLGVFYEYQQLGNSLVVRDGSGNTILTANLGSRRLNTSQIGLTNVRIHGHLLLVSMPTELLAIDLLQAARNPSAPILWRKELLGATPGSNAYQQQIKPQSLKHPWGDSRTVFADANKHLVGATASLTQWGFCYFNMRELVCIDPISGETIWSRDGLPHGSDLFGDDQIVFVVPPGSKEAQIYSAIDGQELGVREVDELDYRWTTCGRNVLAWSQDDATEPLTLRLYDAESGQEIWREAVPADSKASLIEDDEIAILQSDGRFIIRSLKSKDIHLEQKVQPEQGLMSLYTLRSRDQYLLVTNRTVRIEPNTPAASVRSIISGSATPLVTGHVYAFDRQSGKSQWPEPAEVDRYGFPVDQPSEMPVLVFMRHHRPTSDRGSTRQHTSVLALHRRDGYKIAEIDDIPAQTYTYDLVADRLKGNVVIGLPAKTLTMTLTERPRVETTDENPAEEDMPAEEAANAETQESEDVAAETDP